MHLLRDGTAEAKKRPQTSPRQRRWPEGALQGTDRLPQRRIPGSLIDAIRSVPCGHGGLRRHFSGGPLQALLLCLCSSRRRAVASAPLAKGNKNRRHSQQIESHSGAVEANLSVSNVPGAASTGRLGDVLESDAGTLIQQKIVSQQKICNFYTRGQNDITQQEKV
jgi:hypothetical protein